jgi:ABC-type xylose transport system permease subunit
MIISKMIVSRLSRKPDKNWAVFTALFLIFISFVIASLLPSLKGTQNLELIFTSLFVLISWDMVNAMVGGAIDQAVESANQQNIDNLKANTQEEYLKKQDAEFQAWVSSKYVRSSYSLLQNDRDLEISKKMH